MPANHPPTQDERDRAEREAQELWSALQEFRQPMYAEPDDWCDWKVVETLQTALAAARAEGVAEGRVKGLEADKERLRGEVESWRDAHAVRLSKHTDLATRLQKYEAALHLYGRHLHDCSEDHDCKACSCGFRAALTPAPASASGR